MGRHPLASLPIPLLLLTFGCAVVSLSRAAIVTINDLELGIQPASLGRRERSSSSGLSSYTKDSLAPVPSTKTSTTSTSQSSSPTASNAIPSSTGFMTSTTSRDAAPTSGPDVSSPTKVPSAIIGVAVVGFLLLLAVGGGWWWWWRRRRRGQNRATISLGEASPSSKGDEPPTGSRGEAESGLGDSAPSTRQSCTSTLRRDTLLSESAMSDTTTLRAFSESPVEFRTASVVRFKTPTIQEDVEPAPRSPRGQSPPREHDTLEHLATRLRAQAMLPPVLPIQAPILLRGPSSPTYTPPRVPPQARRYYGEYDLMSPITPLSPRPESAAEGKGVP
ncbi:hypothetical protein GSI_14700 [Ganoderma sinense ZZ0214-1]|uniref:Transporter n=1 Tax=Ganoderma sinense ZZ0214-1 TaxID=1077348 RepID=A0A2G8RPF5_9APHY|nr:hypothetical protein GSI_14700 [Ganoderma sinense ZZ0214-1]